MSEQQISTAVAVRPENRRWVSDPVPAITEAAATGETAAIFADIRQVLGVDCRQPDLASPGDNRRRLALGLGDAAPALCRRVGDQ